MAKRVGSKKPEVVVQPVVAVPDSVDDDIIVVNAVVGAPPQTARIAPVVKSGTKPRRPKF